VNSAGSRRRDRAAARPPGRWRQRQANAIAVAGNLTATSLEWVRPTPPARPVTPVNSGDARSPILARI